jgi:hypothetical protein
MAKYLNAIMTNAGYELLFKSIKSESKIVFTHMAAGSGINFERTIGKTISSCRKLTALCDEQQRAELSVIDDSGNQIYLEAKLSSKDIANDTIQAEGYDITEIGIFAKDGSDSSAEEVLYAVIIPDFEYDNKVKDYISKSDYMPPYTEGNSDYEYTIGVTLMINDA